LLAVVNFAGECSVDQQLLWLRVFKGAFVWGCFFVMKIGAIEIENTVGGELE